MNFVRINFYNLLTNLKYLKYLLDTVAEKVLTLRCFEIDHCFLYPIEIPDRLNRFVTYKKADKLHEAMSSESTVRQLQIVYGSPASGSCVCKQSVLGL